MPNSTTAILAGMAMALCTTAPTPARAAESGHAPLRPMSECIDPGRVRSWRMLDDDRVLVDAGRRHYLIELQSGCPELSHNPFLGFISNNPIGRVCGDIGDRLVPHGSAASGRPQCAIRRLQAISGDQHGRLLDQRPTRVSFDPTS
jgi:hypothetical protein